MTEQGLSRDSLILLLALSAANFVVGMGAFMVVGMITPVGAAFGIDPAAGGWMMTIYALVYAVSSPIMVASIGAFDRKRVVMTGMTLFLLGSALAATAWRFEILLAGRAVMAFGAGIVTPIAASIGVVLSRPEKRGAALSLIFGGITLAQVFGVPVGAFLAYGLGWQAAFIIVSSLSAIAIIILAIVCPSGIVVPPTRLAAIVTVFATPRLIIAVSFTAILMSSTYIVYTYLAPIFEAKQHLAGNGVTVMLTVFGAGAVVGNIIGGMLTDRIGSKATLMLICLSQLVLLPAITLLNVPLPVMIGIVAIWSICTWAFMVPQQARLSVLDYDLTPVLFALNAAAIYIGASVGSAIGGQILRHSRVDYLGIAAALIAIVALASLVVVRAPPKPKSA